jgi:hypothetical protein
MDKDTRNAIERATQKARKLLEDDFAAQLEGDFDVLASAAWGQGQQAPEAAAGVRARQGRRGDRAQARRRHDAADGGRRLPARRGLHDAQPLRRAEDAGGPRAGAGVHHQGRAVGRLPRVLRHGAGSALLPDSQGYRLYIESLFDELSTEVKVLFDRRDPSSVLWPKRATFERCSRSERRVGEEGAQRPACGARTRPSAGSTSTSTASDERKKMREESQAPRNSRELAVRNQFFTPRYVVQFLTDNTLGRIWYEMRGGKTALADRCEYMVRKPDESSRRGRRRTRATCGARPGLRQRALPAVRLRPAARRSTRRATRTRRCSPRARRRARRSPRTTRASTR